MYQGTRDIEIAIIDGTDTNTICTSEVIKMLTKLVDFDINKADERVNVSCHGNDDTKDIAIIGMAAKLPMAENVDEFWENLRNGIDCVRNIPESRRKDIEKLIKHYNVRDYEYADMAFLDHIDNFDYNFFGISPKEASLMDPNQRIFLETAWKSIEDAGYGGEKIKGSRTGVYVGFGGNMTYYDLVKKFDPSNSGMAFPGNIPSILASRVSYMLDLKGPSILVDTACSSSLVALHIACNAIRNKECDMAIAGGIRLAFSPLKSGDGVIGTESSDGRTKSFDESADGSGGGEGVVALLLKPLAQALEDGDNIHAVIKGSSVNQDGTTVGITAPNPEAQEDVIVRAWKDSGINPETITYVEAHGSGTKLGDPIEIEGLQRAFGRYTNKKNFCAVGSVKTNIGHLGHAAGMAGLLKLVLSLKNKELPATLHFKEPNKQINFEDSPVYVNPKLVKWEADGFPLRSGVSCFGISGTNCHVVLEEAPERKVKEAFQGEKNNILALSAKSENSLYELVSQYYKFLKANKTVNIDNVCYTANTGREHHNFRLAIQAKNIDELTKKLEILFKEKSLEAKHVGIYFNELQKFSSEEIDVINDEALQKTRQFVKDGKTSSDLISDICSLYVKGASIVWGEFYSGERLYRISLPTYPFEKTRCWLDVPNVVDETEVKDKDFDKSEKKISYSEQKQITTENDQLNVVLSGRDDGNYSEMEKIVAKAMYEVLGVDEINIGRSFFDYGGHSLNAILFLSKIHKETGIEITLTDMFDISTVKDITEYILEAKEKQYLTIAKAKEKEHYPLSPAQRRLYILNQLDSKGLTYNMPGALVLEGRLDKEKFENAFRKLVERHETLRTTFQTVDGEPVQIVNKNVEFEVEYYEQEEETVSEKVKELIRPFTLNKAPLLRVGLLKIKEDKYIMVYDMHHIISDGMSMAIIIKEFMQLYRGYRLPALKLQYKDFSEWQNNLFETDIIAKQEEYWKDVFKGDLPLLAMPLDHKRPDILTFSGGRVKFTIPKSNVKKIQDLVKEQNTTINIFLFSVYTVLLNKYSAQNDITIGSLVAGRQNADLENVVGVFINFLPIRMKFGTNQEFIEFLKNAKSTILKAYDNQTYPFDKIVEHMSGKVDHSRNPLFDTMLVFHNQVKHSNNIEIQGLKFSPYDISTNSSALDFKMDIFFDSEGNLECLLEYNSNLFEESSMETLGRHYSELIQIVLENPRKKISDMNVFSNDEKVMIEQKRAASQKEQLNVVISATFTAELVESYIKWWGKNFGEDINVQFAPYNQVFQELLDPESITSINPGINALFIRFEDWIRHDNTEDEVKIQKLENNFEYLKDLIRYKEKKGTYFVGVFPTSTHIALGEKIYNYIEDMNARWKQFLEETEDIYTVDFTQLADIYNFEEIFDPISDKEGHMPFTDKCFAAIGTELARKICSYRKQLFKVIVLDCDNTLWKGICGEDGPTGVSVEGPYAELQKFMIQKSEEGMLLCLCSKNNEADVWEVFEKNEQMLLKREHIAGWEIGWEAKSGSIKKLAKDLNLGIDSFIFVDDNPTECAEVMMNCPEVLTIQLPKDPEAIPSFLKHIWAFDKLKVTDEDRKRTTMYIEERKRRESEANYLSLDEFIKELKLKISINKMDLSQISRVSQLTQRTNQFNLSVIRRNVKEINELIAKPGISCRVIEASDRFGDYGLVGVLITAENEGNMFIDTFLLSCRILGKRIENAIFQQLKKYCENNNICTIEMSYKPTAKNMLVLDFAAAIGFVKTSENDEYIKYSIPVKELPEPDGVVDCYFDSTYKNGTESNNPESTHSLPNQASDDIQKGSEYNEVSGKQTVSKSNIKSYKWDVNILNERNLLHKNHLMPLINYTAQDLLKLPTVDGIERYIRRGEYEEPTNETEEILVQIWRDVLKVENIGINDDFFELGGHSLKAMKLIHLVNERLNTQLTLMNILKLHTIKELANYISKSMYYTGEIFSEQPFVLLNKKAKQNVFAFPSLIGYAIGYNRLAMKVKSASFYSFEFLEAEDRINKYIDAITSIQPEGPYVLLGYSAGANLAYEVGKELERLGHKVSDLIVMDAAPNKEAYTSIPSEELITYEFTKEKLLMFLSDNEGYNEDEVDIERVLKEVVEHSRLYAEYSLKLINEKGISSRVHLIRSDNSKHDPNGEEWVDYTNGLVKVYKGMGPHDDMIFEKYADHNGLIINDILTNL